MIYRIMIVEDEPPSMRNIEKNILSCGVADITICGCAYNGEEALRMIPEVRPHIILSDIQMPVMDGFALIEQLHQHYPDIMPVILSGYQEFHYVKKALQFQISDYLLKPIDRTELANVLEKLKFSISNQIYQSTARYLRACIGNYKPDIFPRYPLEGYGTLFLTAGLYCNFTDWNVEISHTLDKYLLLNQLTKYVDEQHIWIFELENLNCLFAVIGNPEHLYADPPALEKEILALFPEYDITAAYTHPVPIEQIGKAISRVHQRVKQALIPRQSQLLDADVPFVPDTPPPFSPAEIQNLTVLLEKQRLDKLTRALTAMLGTRIPPHATQMYIQQVLGLVIAFFKNRLTSLPADLIQALDFLPEESLFSSPFEQIPTKFANSIAELLNSYTQIPVDNSNIDMIIRNVAAYLRHNFNKPIEFSSLAQEFGISNSYLSTLFKKQYGVTPMKYLLRLRVEHAKKLIASDPKITFREIAVMVGYEDAHYFSRIFRTITGFSPSEFRTELCKSTKKETSL